MGIEKGKETAVAYHPFKKIHAALTVITTKGRKKIQCNLSRGHSFINAIPDPQPFLEETFDDLFLCDPFCLGFIIFYDPVT